MRYDDVESDNSAPSWFESIIANVYIANVSRTLYIRGATICDLYASDSSRLYTKTTRACSKDEKSIILPFDESSDACRMVYSHDCGNEQRGLLKELCNLNDVKYG